LQQFFEELKMMQLSPKIHGRV